MMPWDMLVKIAEGYLGVEESPRGSNRAVNPLLKEIFAADDYKPGASDDGYAWCASAVSLWMQKFIAWMDREGIKHGLTPPRLCRAFDFIEWARRNPCTIWQPGESPRAAERGQIVVYKFSHVEIVTSDAHVFGGDFIAIGGNSNDEGSREGFEVCKNRRQFRDVRALITLRVGGLAKTISPSGHKPDGAVSASGGRVSSPPRPAPRPSGKISPRAKGSKS